MLRPLLFAILSHVLLLAGCSSTGNTSPDALIGREWRVTRLEANDVPAEAGLRLLTEANRLSGRTGVNQFHGEARFGPDGAFRAGPFALTRRAGPPEAMERETLLLVALEGATRWRLMNGELQLLSGETVAIVASEAGE